MGSGGGLAAKRKRAQIFKPIVPHRTFYLINWDNVGEKSTLIKRKQNFPHIKGNSDGIGCKVIYEEGLPNI